jgi:crotonobetainyl-CoA:carnitine CoA-transferase CaiB-like acyl-CoA transferase
MLGPYATQMLGDYGADIVKIESPVGDSTRATGPALEHGMAATFLGANRSKRSIVLDLKLKDAREALMVLIDSADVLVYSMRPQKMAALGLAPNVLRARNPQLVVVAIHGFAENGPYAGRPAYDDIIQGLCGLASLSELQGREPAYLPTVICDKACALYATQAILIALLARAQQGHGSYVEMPMFEAMAQFILGDHMAGLSFEPPIGKPGYARLLTPNRKPYLTTDGMLCVLIYNDKHWKSFFEAIGESEGLARDPRFITHSARAVHIDEVYAQVAHILRTRSTAQWQLLLDAADVPNMPMNTPEDLLSNVQLRATGFVSQTVHPSEGPIHTLAHPTKWSATPPARRFSPAPRLGEHTRDILGEAGYAQEAIDDLITQGACRTFEEKD